MKKQLFVTFSALLLLVLSAGAYVFYVRPHVANSKAKQTDVLSDTDTSSTQQSGATSQSTPLTGSLQNQVLSAPSTTQNSPSPSTSTPSPSAPTNASSGDKATLNPNEFTTYDKYKSNQTALFAEISAGTGVEATVGKKVSVNYRGWLTNGQLFDQNLDTAKPFAFTLGAGSVIRGWEETVAGMKVGSERLLIIPPAVGYGNAAQGSIPANSVLVFYVKLLKVE